jgi:hypothetical protein
MRFVKVPARRELPARSRSALIADRHFRRVSANARSHAPAMMTMITARESA